MTTVTITVSGPAQKRVETQGEESKTVELTQTNIVHSVEFSDPQEFHRAACSQSATSMAGKLLDDEYFVERNSEDEWSVSYEGNAVEAEELARVVAEDGELTVVEILTLWLQNLGAPRIRRALHGVLVDDHSVPVDADAF